VHETSNNGSVDVGHRSDIVASAAAAHWERRKRTPRRRMLVSPYHQH
jgi:hypothetical protein